MAVRTEKDLSDQQRGYWLKAMAAFELRNFSYSIDLLQTLLHQEPEFFSARQMLRRVEVMRAKSEKKGFFNIPISPLTIMKAQRELKKDPLKAIESLERILETEPYHQQTNLLLKEAAVAAGFAELAVFALETLLENDPRDLKVLHELGRVYQHYGQSAKAVEIYNRITEIEPNDLEAVKLGKDAAARATMQQGGWREAESYRDLIKDKETAVSLEQQGRVQLGGESLDQQISEAYARHQAEPQSVDHARRLGALLAQKEDFENAIEWYRYCVELTHGADPGLVRKVADLKMRQLERGIREDEEYLARNGISSTESTDRLRRLKAARQERAFVMVEEARRRLDRNPTDLQLRFELGEQLAKAGEYREALPELQRARQNPNARLRAMNLLGRCYRSLGMLDLAAKQLEDAAQEILVMDAVKKEVLYDLALVYEQMGNSGRYLEAMKKIYEADYGFRDVAERVERSYAQQTDEQ